MASAIRQLILKMANSLEVSQIDIYRPFTVIVEGNIGSGKTTFLKYFSRHANVGVYAEPIEMWRNCRGHNLLDLMYNDPRKWSFTFQSYVQLTMLKQHTRKINHPVKLMERSVYSARYCFVEKLARDGLMADQSVAVIDEWFKYITKNENVGVDLIVYLRTTPEIVYERILQRNRSEEKAISLQYVKDLHSIHEDWLYHKTLHICPAPVVVLNGDLDKSAIEDEYEKYQTDILNIPKDRATKVF